MSVCKLIQQNYKILFNNSYNKPYAIIYNHAGDRIININSINSNTFKLWTSNNKITFNEQFDNTVKQLNNISLNTEEKINLWHRRFAHFNIDSIKKKLIKNNIYSHCPICSNSKLKNKPYKPSLNRSKQVFELLHMDLVGSVDESLYGSRYFSLPS